jgi:hypothetical protein
MAKKQFSIHIESDETFFVEEIWPDGDAPANPTVADVRKALFGHVNARHVDGVLDELGMLDFSVDDVTITDQTAFVEQMEKLAQRRKEEGLK